VFTLFGSIFLAAFIFLRAAIFNHVDNDTGIGLGEGQWLDSLELTGLFFLHRRGFHAIKVPLRKE